MRFIVLAALMAAVALPAAAEPQPAEAQMLREMWAETKVPDAVIVQPVFGRVISFKLPRGFVTAWRQQAVGQYITEYIPDGETLDNWTRMITVTGRIGAGAARVEDEALADVLFNRGGCEGWLYRDFGAAANPGSARRRNLSVGCGVIPKARYDKAVTGAAERSAIALFRDDETIWTVQYAERNLPGGTETLFDPATAPALLDKLSITSCQEIGKGDDCAVKGKSK